MNSKRLFKRLVLKILTLLPIPAISFGAEREMILEDLQTSTEIQFEQLYQRLSEQTLPRKYYEILDNEGIYILDDLWLPRSEHVRKLLLDEFLEDEDIKMRDSGTVSFA